MTDIDTWRRVLKAIEYDRPPALELARQLASALDISMESAQKQVADAIDAGVLVEEGEGFGGVTLADNLHTGETAETAGSGDIEGREAGSPDDDPQGENGEDGGVESTEGLEAFQDAIRFFHAQLDSQIGPDADRTAREHFREHRGWSDDTIDEKILGWAPASETALLDHLMRQGYDREAILATGLFWDDLSPIWKGRLVFPYLDGGGPPVFAISRSTDHPRDDTGYGDGPAKYHKIPGREDLAVEEPIYGLGTVDADEEILITEGIADAITAHQTGYACVSPVTTTFKRSDRERLATELRDRDVDRVYIVQDAEAPGSDLDEEDRLTTPQYGEGVRGAVSTAAFLDDAGIDAYLGELPRPGLRKVDLDDYIQEWGSLNAVLASAKPASQHRAYDTDEARTREDDRETDTVEKTGELISSLFDLDLSDVAGVDRGERATNPLGHHGDSENYYVVDERAETAYDHKYKASYTALTHLLVEEGTRDADSPEGSLEDDELFNAWKYAKEQNHLGDDDPVPYGALRGVAVRDGIVDPEDLVQRSSDTGRIVEDDDTDADTYLAFPRGGYNRALKHVQEEYGVDAGRDLAEGRDGQSETYETDPRDLQATVDPRRAWDAAGRATPDDLERDQLATDDGSFVCPDCDSEVDVVRAVAIEEGFADGCDSPLNVAIPRRTPSHGPTTERLSLSTTRPPTRSQSGMPSLT